MSGNFAVVSGQKKRTRRIYLSFLGVYSLFTADFIEISPNFSLNSLNRRRLTAVARKFLALLRMIVKKSDKLCDFVEK